MPYMKKLLIVFTAALCFSVCCLAGALKYNRGIGVYPGNPDENFSPVLKVDDYYRNIALHRAVYASSSYDYCLTGQLLTDGIISKSAPKYFKMATSENKHIKREQEWLIDQHYYTQVYLNDSDAWVEMSFNNGWSETFDCIKGDVRVSYLAEQADGSHEVKISISKDGQNWEVIKTISGNTLIGDVSRPRMHSDPDKADALGNQLLPTRKFSLDTELPQEKEFSFVRIDFSMKGAQQWIMYDVDFYHKGKLVNLVPSKEFNSTWMTLGEETEWAYVDLGNSARFNKIVLHWLQNPCAAHLQTSDDAVTWKNVAEVEASDNLCETISVNGKGRYVRILMNNPDKKSIMLSEMEVWGKGGVTAVAAQSPASSENEIYLYRPKTDEVINRYQCEKGDISLQNPQKIASLKGCDLPKDDRFIYESAYFAIDNDSL
jgi:hypothetical protein